MADVLVRPASTADLDDLVELLAILFALEEDFQFDPQRQRRGLEMMLVSERAMVLAAESGGRVIGMCTGQCTISTAEGGLALLVEDVVVTSKWQGRGIGRKLLEALAKWAAACRISRLQLLADRHNDPALAFYTQTGWQRTELIALRRRLPMEE